MLHEVIRSPAAPRVPPLNVLIFYGVPDCFAGLAAAVVILQLQGAGKELGFVMLIDRSAITGPRGAWCTVLVGLVVVWRSNYVTRKILSGLPGADENPTLGWVANETYGFRILSAR